MRNYNKLCRPIGTRPAQCQMRLLNVILSSGKNIFKDVDKTVLYFFYIKQRKIT